MNYIKKRKGSVKISTTIYKTCVSFHFYFLLHWTISNLIIISCYHSTINHCTTSMTSYVEPRIVLESVKTSTNISELSPIHRNWLWIHLLKIYRQFIGTGCTRSVVKILKVFTTNHNVYEPVATTIEEHDEWLQFCQREVRKNQTGLIAEQVSHQR